MSCSSLAEPSVKVPVPEEHVPRPPNAWIIFRQVKSQEYREAHPDQTFTLPQMSKIMSKEWREASDEEIRHFEQLAHEKLLELLALHPDYKYRPRQRGSGDKRKKPRKVKEGGVTKPKRTKKGKTPLTSTADIAPTQATNVYSYGGEWPEANDAASNNVVGLGPAVAPSDQYAVAWDNGVGFGSAVAPNNQYAVASENVVGLDFAAAHDDQQAVTNPNHTFCDNTIFSPDTFDASIFNCGAQPMAYYGQPYAAPSHTAMQPFVTSQINTYQPTAALGGPMQEGYTAAYNGQFCADDGSLQPFNANGVNTIYEQTPEVDVAAGASGAYATAYSQNEGGPGYYFEDSTPYFTHANATADGHVVLDATADANGVQYSGAVLNNLTNLLAVEQELQNTWAAAAAAGWVGPLA